jgi:hypothetical protein
MNVMVSIFRTPQIQELLDTLADPTILRDIGVLLSCLVCAWALVRWIRGRSVDADSIWFGKRIFDGVLFPIAALGLAYGAKAVLLLSLIHI